MAPTLYGVELSPPVRSVLILGKALGIEFNFKNLDLIVANEHKKPEYLKINPQHTVPALVEEDGFVLWDSHVINAYLVDKYGKDDSLYPKDLRKRALVNLRLHFDNGTFFSKYIIGAMKIFSGKAKRFPDEILDGLKEAYGFIEIFLENSDYVAGNDLTIADFSIATTLLVVKNYVPLKASEYPKTVAWIEKMQAIPYFKEANEKGQRENEELVKSILEKK